jgi:hypothetical protein
MTIFGLRFLGKTRVFPIFWTVTILPPISILGDEAIMLPRALRFTLEIRRTPDTLRRLSIDLTTD